MDIDRSRQHYLQRFYGCMLAFSFLFMFSRVISRLFVTKNFRLDDYLALTAWLFISCQTSMDTVGATYGNGLQFKDVNMQRLPAIVDMMVTSGLMSCLTMMFIRLSIVAMFLRLCDTRTFKTILAVFAGAIAMEHVTLFFLILTQCSPIISFWHRGPDSTCPNFNHEQNLYFVFCVFSVVFDVLLLSVPITLVALNILSATKAVRILLVFSLSIFGIAMDITRLVIVRENNLSNDLTWSVVPVTTWVTLEEHVGLWVACFPAIFPLVRHISDLLFGKKSDDKEHQNQYFFASAVRKAKPRQHDPLGSVASNDLQDLSSLSSRSGNDMDIERISGETNHIEEKTKQSNENVYKGVLQ